MEPNAELLDRAAGVLVGTAMGDALGAGYEFAPVTPDLEPDMIGGGLGGFEPGEWTDDTAQMICIAQAAAQEDLSDLRTPEALTKIARSFVDWLQTAKDVGIQTRRVLSGAGPNPTGEHMAAVARAVHEQTGRSAGNGSLMRTAPIALAYLEDPVGLVEAATKISALTHFDPIAGQACAVWCLLIRHAVITGELPRFADVEQWVPNREYWRDVLTQAETKPPASFAENAWVIGALQAAWSAITHTPGRGLAQTLTTAIRVGHDTDTVAAIAGGLVGALSGAMAAPRRWRRMLHGWPGHPWDALSLAQTAVRIVVPGRP